MAILSKMLRSARMKKILPYIGGDVIDLGCGDTEVYDEIKHKVRSYMGLDRKEPEKTYEKEDPEKYVFCIKDLEKDTLGDLKKRFDTILMIALIEHIFDQKKLFSEAIKLLKCEGKILITTPTPLGGFIHKCGAKMGLFAKSAVKDHVNIYDRIKFKKLSEIFNLKIEKYEKFQLGCNQFIVLKRN